MKANTGNASTFQPERKKTVREERKVVVMAVIARGEKGFIKFQRRKIVDFFTYLSLFSVCKCKKRKLYFRYTGGTQCVSEAYSLDTGKLLQFIYVFTSIKL